MDGKALHKLSYGLYIAGAKKDGKFCGCVVDALMQAASLPLTVILSSMKGNYTNQAIRESGEFSISVLTRDVKPFYIANFGFQSARNGREKWAAVPHSFLGGLPVLEGSAAHLVCKVKDLKEFESHTAFIADVVEAEKGTGEPLVYADYLGGNLKKQAFEAFEEYRAAKFYPE
jgi:Conserved protein/domain typically associated with flavoprotein oxygenases, DIM6/NTAB family